MYKYKTTLRLGGSTQNEIVKVVTAPEFMILGFIHGMDALTKVEELDNVKSSIVEEKGRLRGLYDSALFKAEQSVDRIFGPIATLPERLTSEMLEQFNLDPEEKKLIDPEEILKKARESAKTPAKSKKIIATSDDEEANEKRIVNTNEVRVADLME